MIIFIVTLTRGAPAFPVLIVALVPFRLLVMNRWWPREVLRFVDAWACREGTPEDDEDAEEKAREEDGVNGGSGEGGSPSDNDAGGVFSARLDESVIELSDVRPSRSPREGAAKRPFDDARAVESREAGADWVDEELGRSMEGC